MAGGERGLGGIYKIMACGRQAGWFRYETGEKEEEEEEEACGETHGDTVNRRHHIY